MTLTDNSRIAILVVNHTTGEPLAGVAVDVTALMRLKNPHSLEIMFTDALGQAAISGFDIRKRISLHTSISPMDYRGFLEDVIAVQAACVDPQGIERRFRGAEIWGPSVPEARISPKLAAQLHHASTLNVEPVKQTLTVPDDGRELNFVLRTRIRAHE